MRGRQILKGRLLAVSLILLLIMVLPSVFSPILKSPFSVDLHGGSELSYADTDGDGIPDVKEIYEYGTSPTSNDTDGDGMPDGWEINNRQWIESAGVWTLNPTSPLDAAKDTDNDGLSNHAEFLNGTSPNNPDTDGDGMPDGWEVFNGLNPLDPDDAAGDMDSDGLTNLSEYLNYTEANNSDTDGDGLLDGAEVLIYGTNPLSTDTDGDGMPDGWEIDNDFNPLYFVDAGEDADHDMLTNLGEYLNSTDPWNPDTDGDGMPDGWEVLHGFNPLNPDDAEQDADKDGLSNIAEMRLGTDPHNNDTDSDGLIDSEELIYGTNPLIPDTDGEGIKDGTEIHGVISPRYLNTTYFTNATNMDTDSDGLSDYDEVFRYFTDPTNPDTDGDGLFDGVEIDPQRYDAEPTNATNPDTDGDGMPDGWEYYNGIYYTNHWNPDPNNPADKNEDPDKDGLTNYDEYLLGTNPNNNDTDGDGMPDGWEVYYSLNPLDPSDAYLDNDAAGEDGGIYYWVNLVEYQHNTDPNNPDTDFDGIIDPLDPYPNNQRGDAGWPYPWLMGTISPDVLMFNITTDGTPGSARYWRLASFDRYDGYWWYPSDGSDPYAGTPLSSEVDENKYPGVEHTYSVQLNGTLFSPSSSSVTLINTDGIIPTALHTISVNGSGLRYYSQTEAFQSGGIQNYTFAARTYQIDKGDLKIGGVPLYETGLLTLPQIPDRLINLAFNITENESSVYGKVSAITEFLRMNYECNNTTVPTPAGYDAVDWFLFNRREGTSADFASAFALLARLNNIPTRVVSGFRSGESTDGTHYSVYKNDLHFWDEILFYEMGWVEIDVTSPWLIGPGDGEPPSENCSIIAPPVDIIPQYTTQKDTIIGITSVSSNTAVRGEGQMIVEGFVRDSKGIYVTDLPISIFVNATNSSSLIRIGSVRTDSYGHFRAICLIPWNVTLGLNWIRARAHGLNLDGTSFLPSWSLIYSEPVLLKAKSHINFEAQSFVDDGSNLPLIGTLEDGNGNRFADSVITVLWDSRIVMNVTTDTKGSFNTYYHINDTAAYHELKLAYNGSEFVYPAVLQQQIAVKHNLTLNITGITENVYAGSSLIITGVILDNNTTPSPTDTSITGMWLLYENDYVGHSDINATGHFKLNYTIPADTIPGKKNIAIYFIESDFYHYIYLQNNITVYGNCTIFLNDAEGVRNHNVSITGQIRNMQSISLGDMTVALYVNNIAAGDGITDSTGTFSISYQIPPDTPGGPMAISVTTELQKNYLPAVANATINVMVPTAVNMTHVIGIAGASINISGVLETELGGPVDGGQIAIFWNHTSLGDVPVRNGSFYKMYNISITDSKGLVPIYAVFNASGFYLNSTGKGIATILSPTSIDLLSVSRAVAGRNLTIFGRIYEKDLSPVSGAQVWIDMDGAGWTAVAGANGTFVSVHRIGNLSAGHYRLRLAFNGSSQRYLLASSAEKDMVVMEEGRIAPVIPDSISGTSFELRAQLVGQKGEALAGQKITVVTNRSYAAVTNSTGWINLPVFFSGNASGVMNITIMFNGTELYLPTAANATAYRPITGTGTAGASAVMGISIALLIAAAGAAAILLIRKNRLKAIKDAMERAIYQLEIRDDYHRIVFETYRHLIKLLKRYDYLKKDWETVREFQQALGDALPGVSEKNLMTIFDIFEEARYSSHEMGEEEAAEVKRAFEAFRDEIARIMEERK